MAEDTLKLADDLTVEVLPINTLREQEINAQVMQPSQLKRLTQNIKRRGTLESLPFCHRRDDGTVEIISGHHRVRAARAAGLENIPVLVDSGKLTRSEITAKQIAHNQLSGDHDEHLLRLLVQQLDDPDDMLETGLSSEWLQSVLEAPAGMDLPSINLDWRLLSLAFLPKQLSDITDMLALIERETPIAVAPVEAYDEFCQVVREYGRVNSISSIPSTIAFLIETAKNEIARAEAAADGPTEP